MVLLGESAEKVRYYLAAGTPLVWIAYPRMQEISAHTPDGLACTYGSSDTLERFDILPNFTCAVAELLNQARPKDTVNDAGK